MSSLTPETPQDKANRLLSKFLAYTEPHVGSYEEGVKRYDYSTGAKELARRAKYIHHINTILEQNPKVKLTDDRDYQKRLDKLREMKCLALRFQHSCRPSQDSMLYDVFISANVSIEIAIDHVCDLKHS